MHRSLFGRQARAIGGLVCFGFAGHVTPVLSLFHETSRWLLFGGGPIVGDLAGDAGRDALTLPLLGDRDPIVRGKGPIAR